MTTTYQNLPPILNAPDLDPANCPADYTPTVWVRLQVTRVVLITNEGIGHPDGMVESIIRLAEALGVSKSETISMFYKQTKIIQASR